VQVFLPWILVYLSLYLLQGGGGSGVVGLLSNMRAYLWIPVTQSAYRRVSTELFAHLLDLDHSFHLHRKTGEVRTFASSIAVASHIDCAQLHSQSYSCCRVILKCNPM